MKRSVALASLSACVLAGVALACVKPSSPPLGTTETGPCGGCGGPGGIYVVCPGNDTCPGGSFSGYWTCTKTFVWATCSDFINGTTTTPAGCCTGGVFLQASTTITARSVQTGSGNCIFGVIPLPW